MPQSNIRNILLFEEMMNFTDVYCREIHPVLGILDREMFALPSTDFRVSGKQGHIYP